jgi:hypothetical protein
MIYLVEPSYLYFFHSKDSWWYFQYLNLQHIQVSCPQSLTFSALNYAVPMGAKYIVGSLVGSCVIAYACDYIVSQKKIFGGMQFVLPLQSHS